MLKIIQLNQTDCKAYTFLRPSPLYQLVQSSRHVFSNVFLLCPPLTKPLTPSPHANKSWTCHTALLNTNYLNSTRTYRLCNGSGRKETSLEGKFQPKAVELNFHISLIQFSKFYGKRTCLWSHSVWFENWVRTKGFLKRRPSPRRVFSESSLPPGFLRRQGSKCIGN